MDVDSGVSDKKSKKLCNSDLNHELLNVLSYLWMLCYFFQTSV